MGFLDKFLSKEGQQLINDLAKKVDDNLGDVISSLASAVNEKDSEKEENTYAPVAVSVADGADTGSAAYFKELIASGLPGVSCEENITIGGASFDLVLYRGVKPVLTILLVNKNAYKKKAVTEAMKASQKIGIPCMRFFKEFSNKPEYVIGRIRSTI